MKNNHFGDNILFYLFMILLPLITSNLIVINVDLFVEYREFIQITTFIGIVLLMVTIITLLLMSLYEEEDKYIL